MSSAKVLNVGNKMGEDGLRIIALNVIQNRFAVCESIAATIVYQCRQQGFHGRIEWIGIPYGPKTGHAIVVAHREGDEVNNPSSWGDNWFIMDMWYYNLGMRDRYLWSTKQEQAYYLQKDITDYIGVNGGLKLMGASADAKTVESQLNHQGPKRAVQRSLQRCQSHYSTSIWRRRLALRTAE